LIARPRPSDDDVAILQQPGGLSFPSGHVTFYVCYFGFLFFLVYRYMPRTSPLRIPLLILLALPIALVGLSRIYLGAHWLSDTLGAYLWSSVWLALSISLYQRKVLSSQFSVLISQFYVKN
jgi:undecaprenyl-diphosphatase